LTTGWYPAINQTRRPVFLTRLEISFTKLSASRAKRPVSSDHVTVVDQEGWKNISDGKEKFWNVSAVLFSR
jgi:hypothetical protein